MKKRNKIIFLIVLLIAICILLISTPSIYKSIYRTYYKMEYKEIVERYSEEYNVDANLIYAIIINESKFDANIKSAKDAKGLMQVIDSTAEEVANKIKLEEYNLFNPENNIQIGVKYYSSLLSKYNNVGLALAAYNAGTGNVDKWLENGTLNADGSNLENIPFKETNMYVRKVIRDYKVYDYLNS